MSKGNQSQTKRAHQDLNEAETEPRRDDPSDPKQSRNNKKKHKKTKNKDVVDQKSKQSIKEELVPVVATRRGSTEAEVTKSVTDPSNNTTITEPTTIESRNKKKKKKDKKRNDKYSGKDLQDSDSKDGSKLLVHDDAANEDDGIDRVDQSMDTSQVPSASSNDFVIPAETAGQGSSNNDNNGANGDGINSNNSSNSNSNKKLLYQERRLERQSLLEQIPALDPDTGLSFTKQQMRRMRKRIARGLSPLETAEERQQRLRDEAQAKREEQAELEHLLYQGPDEDNHKSNHSADAENNHEQDGDSDVEGVKQSVGGKAQKQTTARSSHNDLETTSQEENDFGNRNLGEGENQRKAKIVKGRVDHGESDKSLEKRNATAMAKRRHEGHSEPRERKAQRRTKPVPSDYVCSACQNKHHPVHWIHDCPDKIPSGKKSLLAKIKNEKKQALDKNTERGNNNVATGLHEPDPRKVFVSGLPFETTDTNLKAMLEQKYSCGKIARCKLLTFNDSDRCRGQAYVTFENVEGAENALQLSGRRLDTDEIRNDKSKSKSEQNHTQRPRKQLQLTVNRVLNRAITKNMKQNAR